MLHLAALDSFHYGIFQYVNMPVYLTCPWAFGCWQCSALMNGFSMNILLILRCISAEVSFGFIHRCATARHRGYKYFHFSS